MVNTINNQVPINPQTVGQPPAVHNNVKGGKDTGGIKNSMDTVSFSQPAETPITYSAALSPDDMADKGYEMLRKLVTSMLEEQGIDFKIATGEESIDISAISQEEAQELISEDGYFGVEQTSDRIVDFAIATAGGDISRLDAIKEGVESGFNEALDAFGGWLPDISHETFDAVMAKLDAWAAESKG